jgi:hypothetical protein
MTPQQENRLPGICLNFFQIAGSFKILYLEGCMLVRAFLRSRAGGE